MVWQRFNKPQAVLVWITHYQHTMKAFPKLGIGEIGRIRYSLKVLILVAWWSDEPVGSCFICSGRCIWPCSNSDHLPPNLFWTGPIITVYLICDGFRRRVKQARGASLITHGETHSHACSGCVHTHPHTLTLTVTVTLRCPQGEKYPQNSLKQWSAMNGDRDQGLIRCQAWHRQTNSPIVSVNQHYFIRFIALIG